MFFIVVDHDKEEMTSTFTYTSTLSEIIMTGAAFIQLVYTFIFIGIWVMLRLPLAMKKYDNEGGEELKKVEVEQ